MATVKKVRFAKPFTLPSIGEQLPAGEYDVVVETRTMGLHGHSLRSTTDHFVIPDNVHGGSELGGRAMLMKGELEAAIQKDRDDS